MRVHVGDSYVEYSREGTRLALLFRAKYNRGLVHNISKTGIQFRAAEAVAEGETVYLKIHFPSIQKPVKVQARVRWVREEPWSGIESYTHVIGAEFVQYSSDAWAILQEITR